MGTQRKILQAMIALMLIAFVVSIVALRINKKREKLIVEYSQEALEVTKNEVIKDQESKLFRIIYDYTYWDEFVDFIKNPDPEWAVQNISTILESFELDALWMLDLNQEIVYTDADEILKPYKFEKDMLSKLYEKRYIDFFEFIEGELYFFYGATIHPTSDPNRLTDPFGYFFLVKKWDKDLIDNIEKISDCELSYFLGTRATNSIVNKSIIQSGQPIFNWKDEQTGSLVFTRTLPLIKLNRQISTQMQLLISLSALGMVLIIILLLSRFVSRPLRLVSEIIQNEDVTKIDQLKKSSSDFERIGQLIEKFVEQKQELEQTMHLAKASDRLKTAFLNNISHEVRTPLNGIMGATMLISDPSTTVEERQELSELIQISTQRLLRTITEYMDISLLNSESMPVYLREFKIKELISPLKEEFVKACQFKNIEFEFNYHGISDDFMLNADKDLLGKVLHHLLDNAVKFTAEGSVSLSVSRKTESIEFLVKDTGVGIEKEFHNQVFDHFEQEDSSNLRQHDGSGLGMAISKKICDLIGANISFESKKGKGTSFKIIWPLEGTVEKFRANNLNEKNMKNDEMQKPLILIAEDEDSNFTVLKMLIERKLNAEVIRARNGLEAVENIRSNPEIKLVLMDIKMPVMDGFEATGIIKSERKELPIIAITAYRLSGDEHKALSAGCDDYLSKPIQTTVLFEKIKGFL